MSQRITDASMKLLAGSYGTTQILRIRMVSPGVHVGASLLLLMYLSFPSLTATLIDNLLHSGLGMVDQRR
jgi:hypothetical protein